MAVNFPLKAPYVHARAPVSVKDPAQMARNIVVPKCKLSVVR